MKKSTLATVRSLGHRLPVVLALGVGLVAAAPRIAHAQLVPAAPVRESIDANGVDLFTGKLTLTGPALVLGSEGNTLSYYRWSKGSGWSDNLMGFMNQSGSVMAVSLGGITDSFTVSGSTYTSTEGNGATLTFNSTSKIYTYTRGDGTVARFDKNNLNEYVPFSNNGMILDIASPAGEKLTFAYASITYCAQPGASGTFCARTAKAYRVSSVTSSYGYQLVPGYQAYEFLYDPTDPYNLPDFALWAEVIGVGARNLAVSAGTTVASQSFGYGTGGGITNYTVTDAEGRQTKYHMAGSNIVGITYPGHASEDVTIAYSGALVTTVTRAGAGTTSYGRNDSGNTRTVTVTPPAATPTLSTTVYTFDIPSQRMTSVSVTESGVARTTSFEYDSSGRLTKTTMPEGNYVQLTRDSRGNVTQTRAVGKPSSGVVDIVTSAGFDTSCANPVKCNQPNWTRDAKSNQTDYVYDSTHGGVLSVTRPADASGVRPQTRYGYTSFQAYFYSGGSIVASGQPVYRLTSTSSCRTLSSCTGGTDERKTTISYGPQSAGTGNNLHPLSVTTALGDGTLTAISTTTYDAVGNVTAVDGPLAGTVDQTVLAYNAVRQPAWQIGPDPDDAGAAKFPAVKYTYRTDGQLDFVQSGTVTAQTQAGITGMTELARQTTGYDAYYRPIRQQLSGSGGTAYQITDVRYDAAGRVQCTMLRMDPASWASSPSDCNPTQLTGPHGPDRVTLNSYDALSRVWKVTTGFGTSAVADEQTATFTANGKLATLLDAESNRTTYEYDGHDRLVKTRFPVDTKGADQSSTSNYEEMGYDANGNVSTFRTRRNETLQLSYDNLDRLVTKVVPERAGLNVTHTRDVYFGYDLFGDMTAARFDSASGEGITSAFNGLGQLVSTTNNMDGTTRTLSYLYDVAGNLTQLTHPDGTFFAYTRNAAGGLEQLKLSPARGLLRPILDSAGRLASIYRWRTVPGDWMARTNISYDSASRAASLASSGTSSDTTTTFSYNPASQIASTARTNDAYAWGGQTNSNLGYTPDGLNRYGGTFGYDGNGNLTSDSTNTFDYDVENRLVSRSGGASATLRYDPLGRLYEVAGASTTRRFLYDGTDLVAEYNTSGTLLRRYAHGLGAGDDPLVWFEGSGVSDSARRFFYPDERGSLVAVTDTSGNVLNVNTYDEYGNPGVSNVGTFQYTGQVWLPEVGMYYYKARMYSPKIGRFMQTDQIGYGNGMNLYSYVRNDPVTNVDPSGLCNQSSSSQLANSSGYQNGAISAAGAAECMEEVEVTGHRPPPDPPRDIPDPRPPTQNPAGSGSGNGGGGAPPQGDHDYRAWNKMCKRPLTEKEQQVLISRFTAPNSYSIGRPQSAGINMVANRWGIPGGFVTTTFSSNGLAGRNVTTPFHVFRGTTERSIVNAPDGAYMQTHGYGGYGLGSTVIPPSMETGGEAIDLGLALDGINDIYGPEIFNNVDKQAARYAQHHFPGC